MIQLSKAKIKLWNYIIIDFIMKFLKSENSPINCQYESIIIIINKFTKYCHFISFNKTYNIKQLEHVFINRIIRYHGIPKAIISDKNKLFTSNY